MGICWSWNTLFGGEFEIEQNDLLDHANGSVHLITTIKGWEDKVSEASRDGKILVANFSASWCNPCKSVAPCYLELSKKYPSIIFVTVDVDELGDLSTTWDITATPTFFFLKDGTHILDKLIGANKADLEKKIMAVASSR